MKKLLNIFFLFILFNSCSSFKYNQTVDFVDIQRFMGDWYVQAGRFTFLEKNAYNSLEQYKWNSEKKRIDITFSFNEGSFNGEKNLYHQKAWIENSQSNAFWKVQPFWPLKLDYIVIDLASDYSWTAVGVPSGKYLWIMSREKSFDNTILNGILERLVNKGYPINNIKYVKHN